ncbi:hypothetical protein PIB30_105464, partial [Stylosanthes scabra]|nr:hypothetical protein [Stylosanthes scabra]
MNRAKIAAQCQNYGTQEVSSGAAEDEDKEGQLATKGKKKSVPNLTVAQSKLKEGEFATKGMSKPFTRLKATQTDLRD